MFIKDKASALVGLLSMGGGLAAVVVARGFPPSLTDTDIGPSVFPMAYGLVLALLGLLLFIQSVRGRTAPAPVANPAAVVQEALQEAAESADPEHAPVHFGRLVLGLIGAALYVAAIVYAGFALSTVLYLWLMISLLKGPGAMWRFSTIALAVLVGLVVYGVFVELLQVPLPAGEWFLGDD
ncbi:tripartite tricarboxylate transporter TctB family protein [Kerstersia gyiorum]|uniref:tripartite tricarboxylate transporter TctB family protein n=1 Tax=Kerstersia gyiorum TaxID=206506 RepID=UPI0039EAF806